MNYPIWETTWFGGASWIALISVLHVYISHLAVGGGFYIWLTDRQAWREGRPELHDYVRKHTWFFLYLTMVFGGVSGVGIWFIIALVNPAGTALLIHQFVFGWAIEWVFFVGEIVALLLYAYRFEQLDRRARQTLSFFYALFAWLSLFIINGILSFMLTPGRWVETQSFWDGFLNPTFLPSLIFRTVMSLMIAGMFGYVSAVVLRDGDFRMRLLRYCSRWLIYPLPVGVLAGYWYYLSVPEGTRVIAFAQNQQTGPFGALFLITTIILFLLGVFLSLRGGRWVQRGAVFVVVIVGLGWIGGFEYVREISRKPFLVTGYLYSHGVRVADRERIDREGLLTLARWTATRTAGGDQSLAAGRELFNLQCLGCHTIGGIRNDILKRTRALTYLGIRAHLEGQGRMLRYMPPVMGTAEEKDALAAFIAQRGGKPIQSEPEAKSLTPLAPTPVETPASAKEGEDSYLLLAWNDFGLNGISDADAWFQLMPPANTLEAQVIRRGLLPQIMAAGVELSYRVEAGFENPAGQVSFWDHVQANWGRTLPRNIGLLGQGLSGRFIYDTNSKSFRASAIPLVPYPDGGGYQPYPLFTVEARETNSGRLLAAVKVVAPTATELGCRHCHGGGWRRDGVTGLSAETAENILRAHDRINRTTLWAEARAGRPRACQSCHADPLWSAPGEAGVLSLSAAMHGWHANYMADGGAQACALCHPVGKTGPTRCYRGIHSVLGITCVKCHGTMNDHALSLLTQQSELPRARELTRHLAPTAVAAPADIKGRTPWLNEPDCLNCHQEFQRPKAGYAAFNQWTAGVEGLYRRRTDERGIRCAACHGSAHAEYPALNPYEAQRDNLQPLQYSGKPYPIASEKGCEVCHLEAMEDSPHHPNMERMFRNTNLWQRALTRAAGAGAATSGSAQ